MNFVKCIIVTLLFIILLFIVCMCKKDEEVPSGPEFNIIWKKCFGGSGGDYVQSLQQTSDGGYIFAGSTGSNDGDVSYSGGERDYWVVKLDNNGNIQWEKSYGGIFDDYACSVQQTTDGGYIVCGCAFSSGGDVTGHHGYDNPDYWIIKLTSTGEKEWAKCYGGTDNEIALSVKQTSDEGYIVTGWSISEDGDLPENCAHGYWILKLNSLGDTLWTKCIYVGLIDVVGAQSVLQTFDGGYIVTGTVIPNNPNTNTGFDYSVIRLDSTGNVIWNKFYGGSSYDHAKMISQTADSNYIIVGYSDSNDGDVSGNHGQRDCWILKIDTLGDIIWSGCVGGSSMDYGRDLSITSDGGYVVAGSTLSKYIDYDHNNMSEKYWIFKMNSSGNLEWQKCFGGSNGDYAHSIQQTNDGDYIVAGKTLSVDGDVSCNHGSHDIFIIKFSVE